MRGATVSAMAGAFALALVTGCSPVHGVNDAGGGDDDDDGGGGIIDAGGPDATWERGTVTVEVRSNGLPVMGARVIFNEPDGSVASTQNTNALGRASFDLFPHSSVSVAYSEVQEFFVRHNVRTILGVTPGDNLVVGFLNNDVTAIGEYMGDVRVDIRTAFAGAAYYELRVGCNTFSVSGIGQVDWQLYQDQCNQGLEPVDVVVTARDDANKPLAFATLPGMTLSSSNYTDVNNWRTDWERLSINLSNAPDGLSAAQAETNIWRRGLDYGLGENSLVVLNPDSGSSIDVLYPPSFAERVSPRMLAFWGTVPDGINGFAQIQRQLNTGISEINLDLSSDLLPRIETVTFQPNGLVDSLVDFVVAGSVPEVTAAAGAVQWEQTIPGTGGEPDTDVNWEWFFIMPPDIESPVQLPRVPAGSLPDGAWPPPDGATMNTVVMGFIDTTLRSSWDDFRQNNGFELLDDAITADSPPGSEISITIGGLIGFN